MSKNLIPEIAKMLGVELGEEFKVVTKGGSEYICKLDLLMGLIVDDGLSEYYDKELLVEIILGDAEIVKKLPWKPKQGEKYWTFYFNDEDALDADWSVWHEDVDDFARLKAGWVYRTEEEAKVELSKTAAEMGVDYEL